MSTEIRRLIQAIRDAVDYMDIDDACNELEALLASQRPPTEERKVVCTCRHDSGVSSDCDVHPPAVPSPADPQPEGEHPAIAFNRWFETAASGEPFFPGRYTSEQLRTVGWLAYQAGRKSAAGHPSPEAQKDDA